MNAVILACSSMTEHVAAAQREMNTAYPVVEIDRKYHENPQQMRQKLAEALKRLPAETDTVLVAMGYCGGSWKEIPTDKRVVIPRVDDCITMLLHTGDDWHPNLKELGHFYLRDSDREEYTLAAMRQRLCERYGIQEGEEIFRMWFASYTDVDIIDTGAYDCYSLEFAAEAQKNADLIACRLSYVEGSNRILEKLVSGRWDQQFLVAEPGRPMAEGDFLP